MMQGRIQDFKLGGRETNREVYVSGVQVQVQSPVSGSRESRSLSVYETLWKIDFFVLCNAWNIIVFDAF